MIKYDSIVLEHIYKEVNKMSKFKKMAALFLAAVMLTCSLAACGNSTSTGSTSAGTNASAGGGEKTLEFWHIQTTEPWPTIIQASADRFMAANPDVKVNITVMANDAFKQKLSVAMSSGQMPDIFLSWGGGPMNEYVDAGNLTDLTGYMEQDNYKDKFLDAAIAQASYNGKIYGFPTENVSTCTVFYNKEIFEQYGFTEPKTLSDLEAICDALLEDGIKPFSLANKTQWTGSMYFMNFATRQGGTAPFADALSGKGSFENEVFEYAGTKIQEWVDKGYFNDGFNGADEDSGQSRQLLYTGDAAMTIMGSWFVSTVRGENPDFYEKVGAFNFPEVEGGSGNPKTIIGTIGDNIYHIASTSAYPDEAFEMLTYLLDDQAVSERIDGGKIPPLKGMELSDPILQKIFDDVESAPDVQLWYDQSLPPEVSEVHKSTSQEIFGKTMTPAQANEKLQQAMDEYLTKKGG